MKTKTRILLTANALLLAVILAMAVLLTNFVYAGGGIYPKSEELNLLDQDITPQVVDTLREKAPDSLILWNVPFQGGSLPSDTAALTVASLSGEDLAMLEYFPELTRLDGAGCPDYENLAAFQQKHPGCAVTYQVPVSGGLYPQDTRSLTLTGLTEADAAAMEALPGLSSVSVSGCRDYALLQRLQAEQPQWNLTYTASIAGQELAMNTGSASLENATLAELTETLPGLPALAELKLINPSATAQELAALQEQHPNVSISWECRLLGKTYPMDTTEIDISGAILSSTQEVEQAVQCLPNLEKVIMTDCGIDNETMAAFRERQRENYKVVWTVYLSEKAKCRTDALYFMPIEQGEYYFKDEHSYNLRYCEDLVCLDLGHHMIHNVDFLEFMPKLKYLILAHTGIRTIEPIVHCQELVYLEVDWSEIKDYTPIAQLKKLEDLNINETYCDVTPLLQMTWLKNLWAPGRSYEVKQLLIESLPNTHVEVNRKSPAGQGWRDLPNYFAQRDIMGKPYMK